MQIQGMDSNFLQAQQMATSGDKSVKDAQNFAKELQQASQEMSASTANGPKVNNQGATTATTLTPEEVAYNKKLKEACQGFEAMFMQMMYREMRKTVPENSLFGNSNAEKIFQDMLDTKMVDNMASAGGFGFADIMYNQLTATTQARKDMDARAQAQLAARGKQINLEG